MNNFTNALNNAMQQSQGKFPRAAAILAEAMEFDDELRLECALVLIAWSMQPGQAELARIFEVDTGRTVGAFVAGFLPAAQKVLDEEFGVRWKGPQ